MLHLPNFGLPKKFVSTVGTDFVSELFKEFCGHLNIDQAIMSSYHHQSNRQVEACIKFKKCRQNNNDGNFALLQIRSTPVGTGIPSPAMLLLNRPIRVLLPQIGREPMNINKDDAYYETLNQGQKHTL